MSEQGRARMRLMGAAYLLFRFFRVYATAGNHCAPEKQCGKPRCWMLSVVWSRDPSDNEYHYFGCLPHRRDGTAVVID